jgi:agmatine deiminase
VPLDADEVVAIPSPGLVERDGEIIPATREFYIGNAAVVPPMAPNDDAAVEAIQALFPDRAIGLRATIS